MWGISPPKKREVVVGLLFIVPALPFIIFYNVTGERYKKLYNMINWYGKNIVQRVADWTRKF